MLSVPHRGGKACNRAHQLRMSPLRFAQMDSPAAVAPHWVGYSDEHWMPQVPLVHRRVPLQGIRFRLHAHGSNALRLADTPAPHWVGYSEE